MTAVEPDRHEAAGTHAGGDGAPPGHHETPAQRHVKEHLALWLFIGGDAVFVALEIFTWFYLRALDTNGMWRGAACSVSHPCTDGLGNSITHEIPKAGPWFTIAIALLVVVAALFTWGVEHSAREHRGNGAVSTWAGAGALVLLAAVVVQCAQFGDLPFTTVDGAYASSFELLMGSTLAHLLLLTFIGTGLWNRARVGRYGDGRWHQVRVIRIFTTWCATAACVLAAVMILFA